MFLKPQKGYVTANIMLRVFTFNGGWGASDLKEDPESRDQSKTIRSQHVFHILGVKGAHSEIINFSRVCIVPRLTQKFTLVGEHTPLLYFIYLVSASKT